MLLMQLSQNLLNIYHFFTYKYLLTNLERLYVIIFDSLLGSSSPLFTLAIDYKLTHTKYETILLPFPSCKLFVSCNQ